jgi:hypothetical protein
MNAGASSQTLCLSCGFCCDGTLFGSVPLEAADTLTPLEVAGIAIHVDEAETFFMQPCDAHREGCCQVYENRPANCRKYRCELLKKYESGGVSWDEAQQRIAHVRALKDTLAAELAPLVPHAGRWSIMSWVARAPTQRELAADLDLLSKWAPVMVRVAELLGALQQHFRSPRQTVDQSGADARMPRQV